MKLISTEEVKEIRSLEEKFNSYSKAVKLIKQNSFNNFEELCGWLFKTEKQEFEKAINTSEEEVIKFLSK